MNNMIKKNGTVFVVAETEVCEDDILYDIEVCKAKLIELNKLHSEFKSAMGPGKP